MVCNSFYWVTTNALFPSTIYSVDSTHSKWDILCFSFYNVRISRHSMVCWKFCFCLPDDQSCSKTQRLSIPYLPLMSQRSFINVSRFRAAGLSRIQIQSALALNNNKKLFKLFESFGIQNHKTSISNGSSSLEN